MVSDFLESNAVNFPDDVALVELNPASDAPVSWKNSNLIETNRFAPARSQISWQVFNEKANRCANFLIEHGINKGDKVAVIMYNCLDWLPVYFGILKTGAVAVPFNFRYSANEILYCANLAQVKLIFFGSEFIGRIESICDKLNADLIFVGDNCPSFAHSYHILAANCKGSNPNIKLDEDDPAAVYFSSGTTGFPKAILHKHRALTQAALMEQSHHLTSKNDCFLCIPPLYHTGAKFHWFGSLISASKAVLLKGTKPRDILNAVSNEGCTIVWLLVPWAQDILDELDNRNLILQNFKLDQWRLMHIGAQPVPPSLIKRWLNYFPNHKYDTNYGLSESAGPGCVHLGINNIHKVGAIGLPGLNWQAKILDDNLCEVPIGSVGELAVKGDGVMIEYFNNPSATAEVLKNGWLLTGDMARQDSDGFIYLVDRKKDVIITGGENLYPVQIEDFIRTCDQVSDVAVIGLPDKRLGEIAAAIVQLKPGSAFTVDNLADFCATLPRYQRPRKFFIAPVPRNPTGKIDKPLLRKQFNALNLVELESST